MHVTIFHEKLSNKTTTSEGRFDAFIISYYLLMFIIFISVFIGFLIHTF